MISFDPLAVFAFIQTRNVPTILSRPLMWTRQRSAGDGRTTIQSPPPFLLRILIPSLHQHPKTLQWKSTLPVQSVPQPSSRTVLWTHRLRERTLHRVKCRSIISNSLVCHCRLSTCIFPTQARRLHRRHQAPTPVCMQLRLRHLQRRQYRLSRYLLLTLQSFTSRPQVL